MSDTKTQTVANELRAAAARVREVFVPAATARVEPRSSVVTICGNHDGSPLCRSCVAFTASDLVVARLLAALINAREPLAAWLESAAVWHDETTVALTDPNHALHHVCGGVLGADCGCFAHPLAVARALNGGDRG